MANNSINYDRTKPFGQLTAEMIEHIAQARQIAARIQEKIVQVGALGGGAAGAVVEGGQLFGVEAGKGNAYVTAIGYVNDGMRGVVNLAQDQVANIDLGG